MLAIVLAGLVGFRFLPLAALPQVDYPTIQVQTLYPGASPEVMSRTVTAPLERQFGQMAGLDRMSSTSATGVSIVTLQFALDQTLDVAEQQVQAAVGIGLDTLRTAIAAANANSAKGGFDGPKRAYTINANDQLVAAADYKNLIVAWKNGAPVRMSDVARVIDGAENTQLGAWAGANAKQGGQDGKLYPAIILNVQRQPGANVIGTVDGVKKLLPELEASLPGALKVEVLSDRTTGIRASVHHVQLELALAVVMVVLVIFFFLHSL